MQIYCPKCDIGYEIDENLIREKPRKVRCSNCGEIFEAKIEDTLSEEDAFASLSEAMADENYGTEEPEKVIAEKTEDFVDEKEPFFETKNEVEENNDNVLNDKEESNKEDIVEEENKIENVSEQSENVVEDSAEEEPEVEEDDIKIEDIFVRLSEHTEGLIEREKKLPIYEKIWLQIRNILGFHFKIKWKYIFIALSVFVVLSLYNNRYEVVRELPFLNGMYKAFGIKAKISGEGLEFQNVNWNFIDDKDGPRLEIKGFVYNKTDKTIVMPLLHIEILDKETSLLQTHNKEIDEPEVKAKTKVAISLTLENPAPTSKYVYMTFVDKN